MIKPIKKLTKNEVIEELYNQNNINIRDSIKKEEHIKELQCIFGAGVGKCNKKNF